MLKKTFFLSAIILLAMVVSGCGQKSYTEKQIEKAMGDGLGQNVNVDLDTGEVKIDNEDGSSFQMGGEVSLPADFPKDVYVVDGKIFSAMKNVMGSGIQVTVNTTKPVQEVSDLYSGKLVDDGWKIEQSFVMADGMMLSAKKDVRTVSVSASQDVEDKTNTIVVITVMDASN